jgi:hypothetical protein
MFISSVRKQHQSAGTPSPLDLSAEGKVSGPANPTPKPRIIRIRVHCYTIPAWSFRTRDERSLSLRTRMRIRRA